VACHFCDCDHISEAQFLDYLTDVKGSFALEELGREVARAISTQAQREAFLAGFISAHGARHST
jgi:hypothetical protein